MRRVQIYNAFAGLRVNQKKLQFEKDLHYLYLVTALRADVLEHGASHLRHPCVTPASPCSQSMCAAYVHTQCMPAV